MKRWRQFLALSLALLLLLPALANLTPAQADEVEKKELNGIIYSIYQGGEWGTFAYFWGYQGSEKNLVIPEEIEGYPVKVIGSSSENSTVESVSIPKPVVTCWRYSFTDWTDLKEISVSPENENYSSRDGVLYDKSGTSISQYPEGKTDTSLTVFDWFAPWVTDKGFYNPYLQELIVGYTGGDPLVTPPESFNLPNLKRFVTQEGDSARYTVDGILYADLSGYGKTLIRYPAGKYTGGVLQVPEGTKAFYPFAFSRMNNLTAIVIPASVTYIPLSAFRWSENLKDIYFGGTEEAWNELEFAKYGGEILNQITVHFNSTGPISDGWYQEDGKWFYYENGSHITGWKRLPDSHWYYFDETGVLQHGWLLDNGNWYYLNASGFLVTGWQMLPEGHWYYFYGSGMLQHGWLRDGGNWYYLNASGFMVTGWQKLPDGNWYYFNGSGVLQHNWVRYSGNWYYLNASGFMVTGWQRLPDGNWYYFDGSGIMQNGWLNRGGNWYYLNSSGVMQTGWQYIGGSWYYFYPGGNMASSTTLTLGGTRYTFDASGRWVA